MFNLFKKKEGEEGNSNTSASSEKPKEESNALQNNVIQSNNSEITKLSSDLDRVKASV
jgi:hypothetical protein